MTNLMESLVAAVPMPAVLIRSNERIVAANDEAHGLLGNGIVGRHFITALRQPTLLDTIEASLRDGGARVTAYLTNNGRQDTTFRVNCRGVALDTGAGVMVTFEDVTHLEQAGQMRRDFVANVSHELRTPLTALMGFIETLRGPAKDDALARERFLGIMDAEAGRMNRLVGDLLSLSRVESEERVRPTDEVDLSAIVRETVNRMKPLAESAGVTVSVNAPEEGPVVPGDIDQLRQIVTNLLENAVKYSGAQSQVYLTLTEPEPIGPLRGMGVAFSVRDSGPGIAQHHIPRITERFYRVDTHRSREMGGTGLGLAIVKHIVNRHRGRLRIESTAGEGATFTVLLPTEMPSRAASSGFNA